jgi:hypothetical protein
MSCKVSLVRDHAPKMTFLKLALLLGMMLVLSVTLIPSSSADTQQLGKCSISISLQPLTLYYPTLPASGRGFAEVVSVSYSSDLMNSSFQLQYYDGITWSYLTTFSGNSFQYNFVDVGVYSNWAHAGSNELRAEAVPEGCDSNIATLAVVQSGNEGVFQDASLWIVIAAASALLIVLSRVVPTKWFLVIAGAIYLGLVPFTGQRYDVYFLYSSGIRLLDKVSPFSAGSPPLYPSPLKWAYPPLYVPYSSLSYLIYSAISGVPVPNNAALTFPGYFTSIYEVWEAFVPKSLPVLVTLLKLPMVASTFVTYSILSKSIGTKTALTFWIANPFVIFITSIWGQIDPIATAFAVASIYFAKKEKFGPAYLMGGLGAITKVWPTLLIPLILVIHFKKVGLMPALRKLVWLVPPILVFVALYGAYGNLLQSLFVLAYSRGVPTYGGEFVVNGLTWQQILVGLHFPPVPILLYVGLPVLILVILLAYFRRGSIEVYLLTALLVVFLSYNYVNPQYFFWLVPLFLLLGKRFQGALYSALPMIYIALSYNILYFLSPVLVYDAYQGPAAIIEQLKVNVFYNSPFLVVGLFGIVASVIYLLSLLDILGVLGRIRKARVKLSGSQELSVLKQAA